MIELEGVLSVGNVGGGTKDYEELTNKPQINSVELSGNKTSSDLGLQPAGNYVEQEQGKGLSTNDYTNEEKTKLASLENYDDTEVKLDIASLQTTKADKSELPTKTSDLTNDSGFIDNTVNNLTNYELKVNTGASITLDINSSTYVMTMVLKNSAGEILSMQTVDLPLETMVVGGTYDSVNKKIVLELKNGNTIDVPVADLISGLQTEITSSNKLASDLVDDTNQTNKFVTSAEKTTWNGKQDLLTAGDNITIDNNVISASTQKSIYLNASSGLDTEENRTLLSEILTEYMKTKVSPSIYLTYNGFVEGYGKVEQLPSLNQSFPNTYITLYTGLLYSRQLDYNMRNCYQLELEMICNCDITTQTLTVTKINRVNYQKVGLIMTNSSNNVPLARGNTTTYTPTGDYNPATKKYVDDSIASAITTALEGEY